MKTKKASTIGVLSLMALAVFLTNSAATTIFVDDFENGLSQWVGKDSDAHHGVVVDDPLGQGNHVLSFTALNSAGDIFSIKHFDLVAGQTYAVSFDYLGLALPASTPTDLGGFAGLSEDFPGRHLWYYGTSAASGASDTLADDSEWHSYTYSFVAPVTFVFFGGSAGNSIHLMFEDYLYSGGVVGDVYFDNISLSAVSQSVPEPASLLLLGIGVTAIGFMTRRRHNRTPRS